MIIILLLLSSIFWFKHRYKHYYKNYNPMAKEITIRASSTFALNFELDEHRAKGWVPASLVDTLEGDVKFNNGGDEWIVPFKRYSVVLERP